MMCLKLKISYLTQKQRTLNKNNIPRPKVSWSDSADLRSFFALKSKGKKGDKCMRKSMKKSMMKQWNQGFKKKKGEEKAGGKVGKKAGKANPYSLHLLPLLLFQNQCKIITQMMKKRGKSGNVIIL